MITQSREKKISKSVYQPWHFFFFTQLYKTTGREHPQSNKHVPNLFTKHTTPADHDSSKTSTTDLLYNTKWPLQWTSDGLRWLLQKTSTDLHYSLKWPLQITSNDLRWPIQKTWIDLNMTSLISFTTDPNLTSATNCSLWLYYQQKVTSTKLLRTLQERLTWPLQ